MPPGRVEGQIGVIDGLAAGLAGAVAAVRQAVERVLDLRQARLDDLQVGSQLLVSRSVSGSSPGLEGTASISCSNGSPTSIFSVT